LFFLEFLGSLLRFSKLALFLLSEFFETLFGGNLFRSGLLSGFLAALLLVLPLSFFFRPLSSRLFSSLKLLAEAANIGVFGYLVLQLACFGGSLLGGALFTLPRGLRDSFAFLFGLVLVASLLFCVAFLGGFFSVLGLLVLA
jgi:hypothetical protein